MARYKFSGNPTNPIVLDSLTNMSIPQDSNNTDYKQVQAWVALGNTIDPIDPTPDPILPSATPRFQKVKDRINGTALPAATKTALIDILSTLVDN